MLLRNAWYIGAWVDEIDGERPLARRICNNPMVLFRGGMGRVAALADRCSHRAAPLHMGTVVEEGIQCGYHGLVINGSGRCVRVPGKQKIPDDPRVRSYPVIEKHQMGQLHVIRASEPSRARVSIGACCISCVR
jgi:phenylpropionate dioxygenase-like ring-hydroxylating dioxygenase large terminal subunit